MVSVLGITVDWGLLTLWSLGWGSKLKPQVPSPDALFAALALLWLAVLVLGQRGARVRATSAWSSRHRGDDRAASKIMLPIFIPLLKWLAVGLVCVFVCGVGVFLCEEFGGDDVGIDIGNIQVPLNFLRIIAIETVAHSVTLLFMQPTLSHNAIKRACIPALVVATVYASISCGLMIGYWEVDISTDDGDVPRYILAGLNLATALVYYMAIFLFRCGRPGVRPYAWYSITWRALIGIGLIFSALPDVAGNATSSSASNDTNGFTSAPLPVIFDTAFMLIQVLGFPIALYATIMADTYYWRGSGRGIPGGTKFSVASAAVSLLCGVGDIGIGLGLRGWGDQQREALDASWRTTCSGLVYRVCSGMRSLICCRGRGDRGRQQFDADSGEDYHYSNDELHSVESMPPTAAAEWRVKRIELSGIFSRSVASALIGSGRSNASHSSSEYAAIASSEHAQDDEVVTAHTPLKTSNPKQGMAVRFAGYGTSASPAEAPTSGYYEPTATAISSSPPVERGSVLSWLMRARRAADASTVARPLLDAASSATASSDSDVGREEPAVKVVDWAPQASPASPSVSSPAAKDRRRTRFASMDDDARAGLIVCCTRKGASCCELRCCSSISSTIRTWMGYYGYVVDDPSSSTGGNRRAARNAAYGRLQPPSPAKRNRNVDRSSDWSDSIPLYARPDPEALRQGTLQLTRWSSERHELSDIGVVTMLMALLDRAGGKGRALDFAYLQMNELLYRGVEVSVFAGTYRGIRVAVKVATPVMPIDAELMSKIRDEANINLRIQAGPLAEVTNLTYRGRRIGPRGKPSTPDGDDGDSSDDDDFAHIPSVSTADALSCIPLFKGVCCCPPDISLVFQWCSAGTLRQYLDAHVAETSSALQQLGENRVRTSAPPPAAASAPVSYTLISHVGIPGEQWSPSSSPTSTASVPDAAAAATGAASPASSSSSSLIHPAVPPPNWREEHAPPDAVDIESKGRLQLVPMRIPSEREVRKVMAPLIAEAGTSAGGHADGGGSSSSGGDADKRHSRLRQAALRLTHKAASTMWIVGGQPVDAIAFPLHDPHAWPIHSGSSRSGDDVDGQQHGPHSHLHQDAVARLAMCWQADQAAPQSVADPNGGNVLANGLQPPSTPAQPFMPLWLQRLAFALQIARVVAYLHSFKPHPLLHRDLKSLNIFLTQNGGRNHGHEADGSDGSDGIATDVLSSSPTGAAKSKDGSRTRAGAAATPLPQAKLSRLFPLTVMVGDYGDCKPARGARSYSTEHSDDGNSGSRGSGAGKSSPSKPLLGSQQSQQRHRSSSSSPSAATASLPGPPPMTREKGTPQWMAPEVMVSDYSNTLVDELYSHSLQGRAEADGDDDGDAGNAAGRTNSDDGELDRREYDGGGDGSSVYADVGDGDDLGDEYDHNDQDDGGERGGSTSGMGDHARRPDCASSLPQQLLPIRREYTRRGIHGATYGPPADIYSLSIILWELLTGGYPFSSLSRRGAIVTAVAQHHARPPIPDACPRAYAHLLRMCWHPDPNLRPPAKVIVVVLERMLAAGIRGVLAARIHSSPSEQANSSGSGGWQRPRHGGAGKYPQYAAPAAARAAQAYHQHQPDLTGNDTAHAAAGRTLLEREESSISIGQAGGFGLDGRQLDLSLADLELDLDLSRDHSQPLVQQVRGSSIDDDGPADSIDGRVLAGIADDDENVDVGERADDDDANVDLDDTGASHV